MSYTVIDDNLPGFQGQAWLIKIDTLHYVVSAANVPYSGDETMVFPATPLGNVVSWAELVVIRGWDHGAAILELIETLG